MSAATAERIRFRVYRDYGFWVARCLSCRTSSGAKTREGAMTWLPLHVAYHDSEYFGG